jgi:hypothetical protein
MLALHSADKGLYIKNGLICYKCLTVIDFKAAGRRRLCRNCASK